jgi:hypothetical protein
MKTNLTLVLVLGSLAVWATSANAGEPVPPLSPAPQEMAALEHFLALTDDDLDQMQRVIARIRAMGPAERAALRAEIEKFRRLPESDRHQLRLGWGALDPDLQDAWRRMMQAASSERRAEIQRRLQALPPDRKAALRRKLAEEFLRQEKSRSGAP